MTNRFMTLTNGVKDGGEKIGQIAGALTSFGISNTADGIGKAASILQVVSGSMTAVSLIQMLIGVATTARTAEATATTAEAMAAGPPGWALIALAGATAATVGGIVYGWTRDHEIKANLSNPSEAHLTAQLTGGLING